jgi:hypothetical protein
MLCQVSLRVWAGLALSLRTLEGALHPRFQNFWSRFSYLKPVIDYCEAYHSRLRRRAFHTDDLSFPLHSHCRESLTCHKADLEPQWPSEARTRARKNEHAATADISCKGSILLVLLTANLPANIHWYLQPETLNAPVFAYDRAFHSECPPICGLRFGRRERRRLATTTQRGKMANVSETTLRKCSSLSPETP